MRFQSACVKKLTLKMFYLLLIIPVLLLFACNEESEDPGTITFRITNSQANAVVYFSIGSDGYFNSTTMESNEDLRLAEGDFTIDGSLQGEEQGLDLTTHEPYVFQGGPYDITFIIDLDADISDPYDSNDPGFVNGNVRYGYAETTVDGDIVVEVNAQTDPNIIN